MNFNKHEKNILDNESYTEIVLGQFRNWHQNGDFETAVKTGKNRYDYYFDASDKVGDIEKANRNITVLNLTWEELLKAIDFTGFC